MMTRTETNNLNNIKKFVFELGFICAFIFLSGLMAGDEVDKMSTWPAANATVISSNKAKDAFFMHEISYKYDYDGKTYIGKRESFLAPKTGTNKKVYVDPTSPTILNNPQHLYTLPLSILMLVLSISIEQTRCTMNEAKAQNGSNGNEGKEEH